MLFLDDAFAERTLRESSGLVVIFNEFARLLFGKLRTLQLVHVGGTALRQPLEFPWYETKFPFCLCVRSASQTG
jgi:hypothetical protein